MKQTGATAPEGHGLQAAVAPEVRSLVVSAVTIALAQSEGVDLAWLRLPSTKRSPFGDGPPTSNDLRLLDWSTQSTVGLDSPQAARLFFENYELFPGLVVRGWGHPEGRLGFSLVGDRVNFELHIRSAGLLIRGAPETLMISLRDVLPDVVCSALVGQSLERLVVWAPAHGPDHAITSVEVDGGIQTVIVLTKPMSYTVG